MNDTGREQIEQLAGLLRRRAEIDAAISTLIGRPANRGSVGEYVAARIFDIELNASATTKGHDGRFRSGPLCGRTVNVKFYASWEGLLDMHADGAPPEHYLVLAGDGPYSWGIHRVFLFSHAELVSAGVVPKIAASVRRALSDPARVYPSPSAVAPLTLDADQVMALECWR